jgi:hypothetical protein
VRARPDLSIEKLSVAYSGRVGRQRVTRALPNTCFPPTEVDELHRGIAVAIQARDRFRDSENVWVMLVKWRDKFRQPPVPKTLLETHTFALVDRLGEFGFLLVSVVASRQISRVSGNGRLTVL